VLCHDIYIMAGLSVLLLMSGCLAEGTFLGAAVTNALDRATAYIRNNTEMMFRGGCGFFFVAIWAFGGILLTPELKTDSNWIGAIQLGIAAGMLSRRTMPLSALGIAALFAVGIYKYGIFHLADYPVFLGIAVYLALTGLQRDFFGVRAIDIVRYSAGITLMWASVEKWAYPEWSYPLFATHPDMALGFDPVFYMRAAGAIEFALAFSLVWSPLVRRLGATILAGMFIAAVLEFGKVDLIGHTLIIVALFALIADDGGKKALVRYPWLMPVSYGSALALFLAFYYVAHAVLFGTSLT
jgi:hypothetical protein